MERLVSVEVLRAWITGSGLVPAGTPLTHADASWLARFLELRGHTARLVRTLPGADTLAHDRALTRVNALAATAPPAPRAVRGEDGALVRELTGPPECAALLGSLARDAVELLTDPVARAGLRQCEGDNCPIVYVDTSADAAAAGAPARSAATGARRPAPQEGRARPLSTATPLRPTVPGKLSPRFEHRALRVRTGWASDRLGEPRTSEVGVRKDSVVAGERGARARHRMSQSSSEPDEELMRALYREHAGPCWRMC